MDCTADMRHVLVAIGAHGLTSPSDQTYFANSIMSFMQTLNLIAVWLFGWCVLDRSTGRASGLDVVCGSTIAPVWIYLPLKTNIMNDFKTRHSPFEGNVKPRLRLQIWITYCCKTLLIHLTSPYLGDLIRTSTLVKLHETIYHRSSKSTTAENDRCHCLYWWSHRKLTEWCR